MDTVRISKPESLRLQPKFESLRLHSKLDTVRLQCILDTVQLQFATFSFGFTSSIVLLTSTWTFAGSLMRIRSINDVSAAVRGRRLDMGLSQSDLSERSGISRKWISEFESGKSTAEFGLVMRVLEALGLCLELSGPPTSAASVSASGSLSVPAEVSPPLDSPVDLDALLEEYHVR